MYYNNLSENADATNIRLKGDLNANMKVKLTFGQTITLVDICGFVKNKAASMLPAERRETVLSLLNVILYELGACK